MRMPPDLNGHGGSQRAWWLFNALLPLGDVHFVLIYRDQDQDCVQTSLAPLESLAASVVRVNVPGWQGTKNRPFGVIPVRVWDLFRMRSHEAPRLSQAQLQDIARQLPLRNPDMIFAGRLCTAVIAQQLMETGHLTAALKVVDFDDIMSTFRLRQLRTTGQSLRWGRRVLERLDATLIRRAERRIASRWHGLSVCTPEDVTALEKSYPGAAVTKVPNVVARDRLVDRPTRSDRQPFNILFTGNLNFSANVEGLKLFVSQAWDSIKLQVPAAQLLIVGMNPSHEVIEIAREHGFPLHANVPTLRPYYEDCDVVIAPILFGSGTRIKILEAMAYGRPVVSTTVGAEGMGLQDGRHLLLADTMQDFASAVVRLAVEPTTGRSLVEEAHRYQQDNFMPGAVSDSVRNLFQLGNTRLASTR